CNPQLPTNFHFERGRSNIDQNYRLVLSSLYELPWGRGKRWGHDWSRPLDWALGGWQINGIYTLQSGLPFSVCVDGAQGNCITRADLVGPLTVHPGAIAPNLYFDTSSFVAPPATTFANNSTVFDRPGNSGRNILRGPGSSNIDL